ncbi:CRISPR-associated protein Csx19 [Paenibacillus sp. GCM10027627]
MILDEAGIKNRRIKHDVDEQQVLRQAKGVLESFEEAYVYAMMDHTVAFGWCRGTDIILVVDGLPVILDSLLYVQELRLFGEFGEFKAVRTGDTFCSRILEEENSEIEKTYMVYQETHKLWGSVDQGASKNVPGWCKLSSARGTCLYVPETAKEASSKGLIIRSYIEFNRQPPGIYETDFLDASLYRFIDERFVKFVDWHEREGNV